MELKAQVAAIRATLNHIEKSMDLANVERGETNRIIDDIRDRVVRLESATSQNSDLPGRVAHNEIENAVQDAVRTERSEVLKDVRRAIFSAIGAVAALVGVAATVIVWLSSV
jgi:Mg2+ and Co2+ transporter CorA